MSWADPVVTERQSSLNALLIPDTEEARPDWNTRGLISGDTALPAENCLCQMD